MAQICNINEIGELIHWWLSDVVRYQFLHPILIMPPPNLNLVCPKKLPTHFLFQQRMYHFNDGQSVINKEAFLFFRIGFSFRYCIICGMPKTMHFLSIMDLSQVFRQIFVESVFLFSKMIFQTHLAFGNQLSYECDFDCTNLQCI